MNIRAKSVCLGSLVVVFLLIGMFLSASEEQEKKVPEPKLIPLDLGAKEYMRLLGGPPEKVTMHSRLVVLEPGKLVGGSRKDIAK